MSRSYPVMAMSLPPIATVGRNTGLLLECHKCKLSCLNVGEERSKAIFVVVQHLS